ncbi:hypothetical protein BDN72DRAFT_957765 [Pluteus cervinus]|uniref:Uncharacterized protein n=1 Tax=Pluteus cervinus TaxID=181527 RepID=A0ACD3B2T5_9AGAR|nr:hypothetical protein BDN72DRAFT_957765 [Pluteus cervinus]
MPGYCESDHCKAFRQNSPDMRPVDQASEFEPDCDSEVADSEVRQYLHTCFVPKVLTVTTAFKVSNPFDSLSPSEVLDIFVAYEVPLDHVDSDDVVAEGNVYLPLLLEAFTQIMLKFSQTNEETRIALEPQVIAAWPAIFKWSAFFFVSRIQGWNDHWEPDLSSAAANACNAILRAWVRLIYSDKIIETMRSTHGTVEIATKMWLLEDRLSGTDTNCHLPSLLLWKMVPDNRLLTVQDRIALAAGGAQAVAQTVIRRLNRTIAQQTVDIDVYSYLAMQVILIRELSIDGHPIQRSLLEVGGITTTTKAALILAETLNSGEVTVHDNVIIRGLTSGLIYVREVMEAGTGLSEITQAINAGIIEAFVEGSPFYTRIPFYYWQGIESIIAWVIPKYLVYGSIIRAVSEALCQLPDTSRLRNIRHTPAWPAFRGMRKLTLERLLVKRSAKSTSSVCDNGSCQEKRLKEEFLGCSSCHTARYCSSACQKTHWKSGHREDCEGFRRDYLSKHPEADEKRNKIWFELLAIYYAGFHLPQLRKTTRLEYPNRPLSDFGLLIDFGAVPPEITLQVKLDSTTASDDPLPENSDEDFIATVSITTPIYCCLPCGNQGEGVMRRVARARPYLWEESLCREPFTMLKVDSDKSQSWVMDLLQEIAPKTLFPREWRPEGIHPGTVLASD